MVPSNPTAPDAVWGTSCTAPDGSTFSPHVVTPDDTFLPTMMDDLGIWFDFPPVPPGSSFTVFKCYDLITNHPIEVHEWPTVPPAVGGEFIGIETTSVLAAGAQYTAAWMIPVIVSAIGIGIVIARKF